MTNRPEAALHRAVAQYLNAALPKDAFWTTIGHGGGGRVRGAQLKAMGVKAGVPDILVIHRGVPFFIELKSAKGRLSPEQKELGGCLFKQGVRVFVCRSVEDVTGAIKEMKRAAIFQLDAAA